MSYKTDQTIDKKIEKGFRFLDKETKKQRNRFYDATIKWNTDRIEYGLEAIKKGQRSRYPNLEWALQAKTFIPTSTLKWLKEAEEYYDSKLKAISLKLAGFGMLEDHIMIDSQDVKIGEGLSMSFYISAWDSKKQEYMGRAHARAVWVECYEKVSHWRFIVTFKEKK